MAERLDGHLLDLPFRSRVVARACIAAGNVSRRKPLDRTSTRPQFNACAVSNRQHHAIDIDQDTVDRNRSILRRTITASIGHFASHCHGYTGSDPHDR